MFDPLRRHRLLIPLSLAIFGASGLILYLQHRAAGEIDRQARTVLLDLGRQRVDKMAGELRRVFDGAVLGTLFAASTETPSADELVAISRQFIAGHISYPYVARFFLSNRYTRGLVADEVLLFRRPGEPGDNLLSLPVNAGERAGFYRSPAVGRELDRLARSYDEQGYRVSYAVTERTLGGRRYQVTIRWAWMGDNARQSYVVSGYLVDLDYVRNGLFRDLFGAQLAALSVDTTSRSRVYVRDEHGTAIFGTLPAPGAIYAESPISMTFFPVSARPTRLVAAPAPTLWTLGVSMTAPGLAESSPVVQGYWLSGGAIFLMLAALGLAIHANRQAVRLAALKANLVSSVTHQLRTPLSLLNLAGETLASGRDLSPEKMAEYVGILRRETGELMKLVDKTLELSRIESDRRVYRLQSVNLESLVGLSITRFRDRLADRSPEIRLHVDSRPCFGLADPMALEQALVNLLDNAVKYSVDRGPIDIRVVDLPRHVRIDVSDRGIGIPPSDLPHIFDKFYRGSNNRTARTGFGLGLAIVREIVDAHRGHIEVVSDRGGGTTFRILIRHASRQAVHA